jgi:hypothetical protein
LRTHTLRTLKDHGVGLVGNITGGYLLNGLLLVSCLWACGIARSDLPLSLGLMLYSVGRISTVINLTPGGVGVAEVAYTAVYVAVLGESSHDSVVAGVLVYRALTYLLPIPVGAAAVLAWRHAPALIHGSPGSAGPARTGQCVQFVVTDCVETSASRPGRVTKRLIGATACRATPVLYPSEGLRHAPSPATRGSSCCTTTTPPDVSTLSRRFLRVTASATAALVAAGLAVTVPASSAVAGSGATAAGTGAPRVTRVTLVTGDVAIVTTRKGARRTVALEPRLDGTLPQAAITDTGDHLYVVPRTAVPLLAAKRLDLDLFDVAGLMRAHYDDKATSRLPVIVDYGTGAVAARVAGHRPDRCAPLGDGAQARCRRFEVTKRHARAFWKDVTAGGGTSGAPSRLADGAARIDLDGRVSVDLEHSVPQIHAPSAGPVATTAPA